MSNEDAQPTTFFYFVFNFFGILNTSLVFCLGIQLNNKCKIIESNRVHKLFIKKMRPLEVEDMEYLRIINQFMCIEYRRRRSWKVNREPIKKGMECWVCLLGLLAAFAKGALHTLHLFSYIRWLNIPTWTLILHCCWVWS